MYNFSVDTTDIGWNTECEKVQYTYIFESQKKRRKNQHETDENKFNKMSIW